jgi:ABC-type multidrug transport system permease subunit
MQEWYVPITILPGICLLILSSSNIMIDLSREIKSLISDNEESSRLIERKLRQLKLINRAMAFLYLSVAFFVISALVSGVSAHAGVAIGFSIYALFGGIFLSLLSLISLMVYSFRAVKLRQDQYHKEC